MSRKRTKKKRIKGEKWAVRRFIVLWSVLRHAWLNLLSEHITAGRINQLSDENFGRRQIHPPNSSQSKQKLFQYVQTHILTEVMPTLPARLLDRSYYKMYYKTKWSTWATFLKILKWVTIRNSHEVHWRRGTSIRYTCARVDINPLHMCPGWHQFFGLVIFFENFLDL